MLGVKDQDGEEEDFDEEDDEVSGDEEVKPVFWFVCDPKDQRGIWFESTVLSPQEEDLSIDDEDGNDDGMSFLYFLSQAYVKKFNFLILYEV